MFESGKLIISPEKEQGIRRLLEGHEVEIEKLLEDTSRRLGDGRTASVCFCGANNELCLKIYKKPEQITEVSFYLPPAKEKDFLDDLKNLGTRVRVPDALAVFESDSGDKNFLAMETLPAVSIDDVLQGRAELPEKFDLVSFQKDLIDFIEKMHQQRIYHRDLHEGNIMIDKMTGQAYVIDFGAATEFYGEAEPEERGPYHVTKGGRDIVLTSDEAMVRSVIKKLRLRLTLNK
jgi:serine/threonine protein kinase